MNYAARVWIVIVSAFVGVAGTLLFVPPIPQDPAYHLFADIRTCLGIPNFGNVVSNAAFIVVGVLGLLVISRKPVPQQIRSAPHNLPFVVFFISIIAVGIGSAYYHWQPDNESLFWDRLPMTMGFMSITAAIIADRIHRGIGFWVVFPALLTLGLASLVYWSYTETVGQGDLRLYGLVQFLPMLLIPIICFLFPKANYTETSYILGLIFFYGIALGFDGFDAGFYEFAGNFVSGHTAKHLFAALAAAFVVLMFRAGAAPHSDDKNLTNH